MTTEHIPWHEYVTDPDGVVAEYVDDNTSEVYDMSTDAPYFVRVREDDRTDVAPVHDDTVLLGHVALHIQQERAHGGNGRHGRGKLRHLRQADAIGHVLVVQNHPLQAVRAINSPTMGLLAGTLRKAALDDRVKRLD